MSNLYHKIQSIYKRDQKGQIIDGEWTWPEFEYLANNDWDATEKIDGTNIRIRFAGDDDDFRIRKVSIGGRTDNAQIPTFLYERLVERFGCGSQVPGDSPWYANFVDDWTDRTDVTLYGEGFGAKIQKGGGNYIPDGVDFCVFDVKIDGLWLNRGNVHAIAERFDIPYAPLLMSGITLGEAVEYVRDGFDSQWGDFEAEGLVLRPAVELRTRRGDRVITKIKCKDFK